MREVEVDSDGEVDARDVLDACEVEVESDEEADARDDLDGIAVLAMEHVEEVVVLLLELGGPLGHLRSDRRHALVLAFPA